MHVWRLVLASEGEGNVGGLIKGSVNITAVKLVLKNIIF